MPTNVYHKTYTRGIEILAPNPGRQKQRSHTMQSLDEQANGHTNIKPRNRISEAIPDPVRRARKAVVGVIPLERSRITLTIVGTTPLLCHNFDDASASTMEGPKVAKKLRKARDFEEEYGRSLYWISPRPKTFTEQAIRRGRFGFPAGAIAQAMVAAAPYMGGGLDSKTARAALRVTDDLPEIITGRPTHVRHVVRLETGVAMTRHRAQFNEWSIRFNVDFASNIMTTEQVVNLCNAAGFYMGIGDWRPQRGGTKGMFEVQIAGAKKARAKKGATS